nr:uncharacterized protein LOC104098941 [Nicotiana tomentosiformis]
MYRLGGLPLVLQIWFYECCSIVNKYLVIRVGTNVPYILNWKVTETPTYANLTSEVIMSSIDQEMPMLNIATLFEVNADDIVSAEVPAFHIDNSIYASPPYPQNMEQQSKRPYPQNTEQQPKMSYDPSTLISRILKLRSAVRKVGISVVGLWKEKITVRCN